MSDSDLETIIRALAPAAILDVGCGCGHFTRRMTQDQRRVIAVDVVHPTQNWQEIQRTCGVHFLRMDATSLGFMNDCFPLVVERAALHHIARWPEALAEMVRVSKQHVLVEEPIDDLRSEAKQRTFEAQKLLLAVQAEAGYSHYRHLDRDAVASVLKHLGMSVQEHVKRSDAPRSFDEFFDCFDEFAALSGRPAHWTAQLDAFRSRIGEEAFCEDDTLTILAAKSTG